MTYSYTQIRGEPDFLVCWMPFDGATGVPTEPACAQCDRRGWAPAMLVRLLLAMLVTSRAGVSSKPFLRRYAGKRGQRPI